MKVTGFTHKSGAKAYQEQHGGRVLWGEWSHMYGTFTKKGKEYHKIIHQMGIPIDKWMYETSEYHYIVVEEDK